VAGVDGCGDRDQVSVELTGRDLVEQESLGLRIVRRRACRPGRFGQGRARLVRARALPGAFAQGGWKDRAWGGSNLARQVNVSAGTLDGVSDAVNALLARLAASRPVGRAPRAVPRSRAGGVGLLAHGRAPIDR
jgi:hypothetical protein